MEDLEKHRSSSLSPTEYAKKSTPSLQEDHTPAHEAVILWDGETKRFPETDLHRGIVGWDGQNDPANPQNFSAGQKWGLLALMSSITFLSPLASSMFAPAASYVAVDLGVTNETLLSFSVTIFLLGYTVRIRLIYIWLRSTQNRGLTRKS
jgi:hypothetical protein